MIYGPRRPCPIIELSVFPLMQKTTPAIWNYEYACSIHESVKLKLDTCLSSKTMPFQMIGSDHINISGLWACVRGFVIVLGCGGREAGLLWRKPTGIRHILIWQDSWKSIRLVVERSPQRIKEKSHSAHVLFLRTFQHRLLCVSWRACKKWASS